MPRSARESDSRRFDLNDHSAAPTPEWPHVVALESLYRINGRVVTTLARLAHFEQTDNLPEIVWRHRQDWAALGRSECGLLERVPYCLLDLRFRDAAWWARVIGADSVLQDGAVGGGFPSYLAGDWTQDVLALALPLLRKSRGAVQTLFGMTSEVVDLLTCLEPAVAGAVAQRAVHGLRLRWSDSDRYWPYALHQSRLPRAATMSPDIPRRGILLLSCA